MKSKHRLLSVASASHCVVHVVGCTGRQRDAETQRTRRTQRRDAEKYTSGMSFALDIATLSKQLGKTHPLVCSPRRLLRCRGVRCRGDARDARVFILIEGGFAARCCWGSRWQDAKLCLLEHPAFGETRSTRSVVFWRNGDTEGFRKYRRKGLEPLCVHLHAYACVMAKSAKKGRRDAKDAEDAGLTWWVL